MSVLARTKICNNWILSFAPKVPLHDNKWDSLQLGKKI